MTQAGEERKEASAVVPQNSYQFCVSDLIWPTRWPCVSGEILIV